MAIKLTICAEFTQQQRGVSDLIALNSLNRSRQRDIQKGAQVYLAHKKHLAPLNHHRSLGIVLLQRRGGARTGWDAARLGKARRAWCSGFNSEHCAPGENPAERSSFYRRRTSASTAHAMRIVLPTAPRVGWPEQPTRGVGVLGGMWPGSERLAVPGVQG